MDDDTLASVVAVIILMAFLSAVFGFLVCKVWFCGGKTVERIIEREKIPEYDEENPFPVELIDREKDKKREECGLFGCSEVEDDDDWDGW